MLQVLCAAAASFPKLLRGLLLHCEHASAQEADFTVFIHVDSLVAVKITNVELSAAAAFKAVAKQVPDIALRPALVRHAPGSSKLSMMLISSSDNIHVYS
eukprot:GHRQ01007410.1.p3 GENE.GHRQ01007410.1~~GHRQ01007410.1.p3  ORF type:complete len:100 (-),score=11.23 GHRQ01007410.1:100-399(-)